MNLYVNITILSICALMIVACQVSARDGNRSIDIRDGGYHDQDDRYERRRYENDQGQDED